MPSLQLYDEVNPSQIFRPGKRIVSFPVALVNDLILQLDGGAASNIATPEEILAADNNKVVSSGGLGTLWKKGTTLSATTIVVLGDGGYFRLTGPGTVNDIDFALPADGRQALLYCDGAITFTSSPTLVVPGGTFTSAPGDLVSIVQDAGDTVYLSIITRAAGTISNPASPGDVLAGTSTTLGVTPDALAALWERGTDVAAAATLTLGEGGVFHVTGVATITNIDFAVPKDGRMAWLIFDSAGVVVTYNATTLKLPGNANLTSAAGDRCLIVQDSSDNIVVLHWIYAAQSPLWWQSTTGVLGGVNITGAVTADALAALWERGTDVAAAATITLGEGGYFHITGTGASIADIDWTVTRQGRVAWLYFQAAGNTIVHGAATINLPGAANIVTAVGDRMCIVAADSSDVVYCLVYERASGQTLFGNATTTEVLTGTDTQKTVTADALAALWEMGAASLATDTFLGEGGYFPSSGTPTQVNSLQFTAKKDGRRAFIYFNNPGIILKHGVGVGGTGIMLLPNAADYVVATGDVLEFVQSSTNYMICVNAQRADAHSVRQGDFIEGFIIGPNAADPDQDIDIGTGSALDQVGGSAVITLASALVKRGDAAWAAGTNQGGVDTGTLPSDGTVHLFAIRNPTSGVVDAVFSASLTPTMPSGYTQRHRIASFVRAAGVTRRFDQAGDYFQLRSSITEISSTATRAWADLVLLGVPNGIRCVGHFRTDGANASDGSWVFKIAAAASLAGASPTGHTFQHLYTAQGRNTNWFQFPIVTADRTIQVEITNPSAAGTIAFWGLSTVGWIDQRVK